MPMPRGPKGEKRPADVIGNAVHVMRIGVTLWTKDASASALRLESTALKNGWKRVHAGWAYPCAPRRRSNDALASGWRTIFYPSVGKACPPAATGCTSYARRASKWAKWI
jgi:hypothetical protein